MDARKGKQSRNVCPDRCIKIRQGRLNMHLQKRRFEFSIPDTNDLYTVNKIKI